MSQMPLAIEQTQQFFVKIHFVYDVTAVEQIQWFILLEQELKMPAH